MKNRKAHHGGVIGATFAALVGAFSLPAQAVDRVFPNDFGSVFAAFQACEDGDVVRLNGGGAAVGVLPVNTNCTLDLNGWEMGGLSIQVAAGKTFTVRDSNRGPSNALHMQAYEDMDSGARYAGIHVPPTAELIIESGQIIALGEISSAGIGGQPGSGPGATVHAGTIRILGGTVTAYGGVTSFTSTISPLRARGLVNAAEAAAGIGGARSGNGGTVIIEGNADVLAEGGSGAAGIGSGQDAGVSGSVEIGGNAIVVARNRGGGGNGGGAGIGGGIGGAGATVLVRDNAMVTATGTEEAAGIGSGKGGGRFAGGGGSFESRDTATATATGARQFGRPVGGAGIGGALFGSGGNVIIGAGTLVTAIPGGNDSSALGGIDNNGVPTHFGTLTVAGTLRLPSSRLIIPNSDPVNDEVVISSTGVITGIDGNPTAGAQISAPADNRGTIRNDGAIHLADARVIGQNGVVLNHYYEVALDTQGGSALTSPVRVFAGSFNAGVRSLPNPTRSGFLFAGWYTLPNGGGTLVDANSSLTGFGLATGDIGGNGQATGFPVTLYANWEPNPAPNLAITKTASTSTVPVGGTVTFTLSVRNFSTTENIGGVISDTVPAAFSIVSVTENDSSCSTSGQTVSCTLPSLAADATTTVSIATTALSAGTLTNTATVSTPDDADTSDNSSSAQVVVQWMLDVNIVGSGAAVGVGLDQSGINCSTGNAGTCIRNLNDGAIVVLNAVPADGWIFAGWSGACSGTEILCNFGMQTHRSVTATFVLGSKNLTTATDGTGTGTLQCNSGSGGAPCASSYPTGTVVTISPIPSLNSEFTGWSGDCSGSFACEVTLSADRSVTATFSLLSRSLIVNAADGSVLCNGDPCAQSYPEGTVLALTATANDNFTFTGFTGACTGPTCNLTMDAPKTVTANFTPVPRTLSASVGGTGSGTLTSSPAGIACTQGPAGCVAEFGHGTVVTLTSAAAQGSSFSGFGGDACIVVMGTSSPQCQVTMDAAKTVSASFTLNQYALTLSAVNGSIRCNGGACAATYAHGTSLMLTTSPNTNYSFSGFGGACTGTTCNLTMDAPKSVTATFALQQRTLTRTAANGSILCNGGACAASYPHGTMLTLTASPNANYNFTAFSGDCSGTTCSLTMNAAKSVTATFALQSRALTLGAANGSIRCNGGACAASYPHGTVLTLTASPNANYSFSGWSGAGCTGTGSCAVTMDAPKSVTATFALQQRALTRTAANGNILCNGGACAASYPHGTMLTLTASPDANYDFTGFSGDCTGTTCNLTMDAPKSVTANFVLTGTGSAVALSVPASLDLGSVSVGQTGAPVALTVSNNSTDAIQVGTPSLNAAANEAGIALTGNTCTAPLAPDQTCVLTLSFAPGAPGAVQAVLTIPSDADHGPRQVMLSGTGVALPLMPVLDLSIDPASVDPGQTAVLSWTSSDTETCVADGDWEGERPVSGTETVGPYNSAGTRRFGLACTSADGQTVSDEVQLDVIAAELPQVQISADPDSLTVPGSLTLSWTSQNADTCTAEDDWSGPQALSGSSEQTLDTAGSYRYTLVCSNASGQGMASVDVSASPAPSQSATAQDSQGRPVTVQTSAGTITGFEGIDTPAGALTDYVYPAGFFDLTVEGLAPGDAITATLTLPPNLDLQAYLACTPSLCDLLDDAVIDGNTVSLTLTDGGPGDADGAADGTIRLSGAAGRLLEDNGNGNGGGGSLGLSTLIGLAGLWAMRRRREVARAQPGSRSMIKGRGQ